MTRRITSELIRKYLLKHTTTASPANYLLHSAHDSSGCLRCTNIELLAANQLYSFDARITLVGRPYTLVRLHLLHATCCLESSITSRCGTTFPRHTCHKHNLRPVFQCVMPPCATLPGGGQHPNSRRGTLHVYIYTYFHPHPSAPHLSPSLHASRDVFREEKRRAEWPCLGTLTEKYSSGTCRQPRYH